MGNLAKGSPLIKKLIFFVSYLTRAESQRVTLSDIGTVSEIVKWADELDSEVQEMELVSQFRCDGSDGYLAWLDDVLEIRETANFDLKAFSESMPKAFSMIIKSGCFSADFLILYSTAGIKSKTLLTVVSS